MTNSWRKIEIEKWESEIGAVLLFKAEWIDEDFNPEGILIGYFQQGLYNEEHFVVADFEPNQDCYYGRDIYNKEEWPTYYMRFPTRPASPEIEEYIEQLEQNK